MIAIAAVLSMMHYEGDVTAAGGDYVEVAFAVDATTREIQITHTDGGSEEILDFGVWAPEGFRGWGGGNTEDIVIGVDESSRSYRIGPITPGTWTLVIGKAQLAAGAGHYSVDVTCRDDATLPVRTRAAFEPVTLSTERRWYKGDFHVHSTESGDASATLQQITDLARERGIDFVNISDHNTDAQLGLLAAHQQGVSDVLLLRGAEITTYAGHANAVGLDQYVDHRIGLRGRTIEQVIADVTARGALFLVNHPALDLGTECIGCAWNHPTTPWDQVDGIEIITGKWDLVEALFVGRAIELWDTQVAAGNHIAAVSGSDDHRAGMGTSSTDTPIGSPTTLVLADNLSEAALIEGIQHGRTIVQLRGPDDPLVSMRVGDAEIGDSVIVDADLRVDTTVMGGQGMVLQLWVDGAKLDSAAIDSADFAHTFVVPPQTGTEEHRVRIEVVEGGRRIVVTSHLFVTFVPDNSCGCTTRAGGGAPGAIVLGLTILSLLGRRRRRLHCRS